MKTVIIGGGFAGVKAALEISKRKLGTVTLISDEDYFLHHATLYATATGRSKAESVVPLEEIFAGNKKVKIVKDTLLSIDQDRKLAVTKHGNYEYDKLVIAIGSVANYFHTKGADTYTYGIRTLPEVTKLNQHIRARLAKTKSFDSNYVIVGAGPTGVELAGALKEYLVHLAGVHQLPASKIRVTIVEAAPRILPQLSKTASQLVEKRLKALGIKVITGHPVQAVAKDSVTIDGKIIASETVVWTSGVANNPFFAEHPDLFVLAKNGRVEVNDYLEAARDIYVLGDNNTVQFSGMAWPAMDQAVFVAAHLQRVKQRTPLVPFHPSTPPCGMPIGEGWAYVEWHGIYAAGKTGHMLRRRMELHGYKQLLPRHTALAAWRAHDIMEIYDEIAL